MKGVILVNPYDTYPAQKHKVERMVEEFARLGVEIAVVSNDAFVAYITDGNAKCDLNADFVLFFDKDRYTSQLIERCGIRVFNSANATAICDDKMLTHIALANGGIPMPTTLPGALCYNPQGEILDDYVERAIQILGLPMVVKECHGSYGEQVYLVPSRDDLKRKLAEVKCKGYLLQQFESDSRGKDMRVIVIGGKVACAMLRVNESDFRSNVAHGGVATAVEVPVEIATLCERAADIIGLDYCGVDVLVGATPKICEVNSNAMFEAMESVTGVNVARLYARHIVNSVKLGERK